MNTEELFQLRMQALIKELRAQEQLSYKELARRLDAQGMEIGDRVLANRINRGNFSAGFACAVLKALGYSNLTLVSPQKRLKVTR